MSDDPVRSETLFRQLFEQHSAIMLLVDPVSCRILGANKAAVRFYGYSRDEFRAMTIQQINILPPEKIFEILKEIQDHTANHYIVPHRLANGTVRTVEVYATPIHFHDQPFNFAIIHDITERKYAEEALQKSEERFRLAMEATMDGLWDWDIASGDVYYSPGYWLMLGYDAATKPSSAEAWSELIHPDDKEAVYAANYDCIENRSETFLVEYRMRTSDGQLKWIQGRGKAVERDENGYAVRMVGTHVDITERKKAEEALQQSERDIREAKQLLELVLETIPVRLFWKDLNSTFLGCNVLFAEDAGYQVSEELIGLNDYNMGWKEQADMYRRDDLEVMRSGHSKLHYEEIQTTPNGKKIWLSTSKMPLRDANGKIVGILGAYEDITQRKMAEEYLKAVNEDLERRVEHRTRELQETQKQYLHAEKLSAVGMLSASIAHEFNSPLQGVLSILGGLKKRAILEKQDQELLDAAICESERMKNLIRSLQDFNRPSSDKKVIMNVHESLDALLLLSKSDFKNKHILVERNYAQDLPLITAVRDQIKQVLLNLLNNAADACQREGVITVSTRRENDRVAVAIKDTGMGIKPEQMERIFQPFYTTKSEIKGTGLGLSVSYGIVKQHNGEIRVESQPGKGATFTVLLPINGSQKAHPMVSDTSSQTTGNSREIN